MDLFKINYFDRAMEIFSESFKFKKYRLMAKPFAFVTAIALLPLQLVCLLLGTIMLLFGLILRIDFSLITGWHKIVTDEGQKTNHATQVVIYFFSWPFVLFSYVLAGILLVLISVIYVVYGCIAYIWTLGGIKFKAFVGDSENCKVDVEGRYKLSIPLMFTIITAVLLLFAPLVLSVIFLIAGVDMAFPTAFMVCGGAEVAFASLYSFFVYAKNPKSNVAQIEE